MEKIVYWLLLGAALFFVTACLVMATTTHPANLSNFSKEIVITDQNEQTASNNNAAEVLTKLDEQENKTKEINNTTTAPRQEEEPAITEQETEQDPNENLSPAEIIAKREGEILEEKAARGESVSDEDTEIEPVQTETKEITETPGEVGIPPEEDKNINITNIKTVADQNIISDTENKESPKYFMKTVNKSGSVYLGKEYAGKSVEIKVL